MLSFLTVAAPAGRAGAQVGHSPENSPYRDIRNGTYLLFSGGYFAGNGGSLGVAPHDGPVVGLHLTFMGNRTVQVGLGMMYGHLQRLIQDPDRVPGQRTSGPVDASALWLDGFLHFNLAGGKTWNSLAPFMGVGTGVVFTENAPPEDPVNYSLGTKFHFSPLFGTRLVLAPSWYLQVEARFQFWQIKYPTEYGLPPADDPLAPPLLITSSAEWNVTPWIQTSLGWAFRWPF